MIMTKRLDESGKKTVMQQINRHFMKTWMNETLPQRQRKALRQKDDTIFPTGIKWLMVTLIITESSVMI